MTIRRLKEEAQTSPIHEPGHPSNSPPADAPTHSPYGLEPAAVAKLKTIAANIVDCEERAKEITSEKATFFAEAKAAGFDAKALRGAIAYLKDEQGRTEAEQLRDLYVEALRERAE